MRNTAYSGIQIFACQPEASADTLGKPQTDGQKHYSTSKFEHWVVVEAAQAVEAEAASDLHALLGHLHCRQLV